VPRRNGEKALGLYLPKMKHYSTFSLENFKESVLLAGGEVNITEISERWNCSQDI